MPRMPDKKDAVVEEVLMVPSQGNMLADLVIDGQIPGECAHGRQVRFVDKIKAVVMDEIPYCEKGEEHESSGGSSFHGDRTWETDSTSSRYDIYDIILHVDEVVTEQQETGIEMPCVDHGVGQPSLFLRDDRVSKVGSMLLIDILLKVALQAVLHRLQSSLDVDYVMESHLAKGGMISGDAIASNVGVYAHFGYQACIWI
ncbi:hypothetical protein GOP47_0020305 [Adiantum capillus-veneris]|uniref:Uncharacterized protein n=1 Tax=Adiantum capillus-veneris TaxID=13818 RepID=A0A9D4UD59_ADICA|nr:hypothetical protein GOP47_0020305 [Adiantum capillus-veneris]